MRHTSSIVIPPTQVQLNISPIVGSAVITPGHASRDRQLAAPLLFVKVQRAAEESCPVGVRRAIARAAGLCTERRVRRDPGGLREGKLREGAPREQHGGNEVCSVSHARREGSCTLLVVGVVKREGGKWGEWVEPNHAACLTYCTELNQHASQTNFVISADYAPHRANRHHALSRTQARRFDLGRDDKIVNKQQQKYNR